MQQAGDRFEAETTDSPAPPENASQNVSVESANAASKDGDEQEQANEAESQNQPPPVNPFGDPPDASPAEPLLAPPYSVPANTDAAAPSAEDAAASTESAAVGEAVAAGGVDEQELRTEASALFTQADRDKNGSLSHSELKKEIQQDDQLRERLSAAKWKTFFLEIDVDGDGMITEEEFATYYVKTAQEQVLREEAAAVFTKADLDKNGVLSPFELKKEIQQDEQLWQRLSAAKWLTFFVEIDVNGDGVITEEEFVTHYVKTALITSSSSPRLSAKSAIDLGPSAAEVLSSLSPGASPKRAISSWKSSWGLPPESVNWPEWKKKKWIWQRQPDRAAPQRLSQRMAAARSGN